MFELKPIAYLVTNIWGVSTVVILVVTAEAASEATLAAPPPPAAVEEERETGLPASSGEGPHSSPS